MFYSTLLIVWVGVTALFWVQADRRARRLSGRARTAARLFFAAFYLPVTVYALVPLSRPFVSGEPSFPPTLWATLSYLWYPLVLQAVIVATAPKSVQRFLKHIRGKSKRTAMPASAEPSPTAPQSTDDSTALSNDAAPARMSRRETLALAASFVPPIATIGLTGLSITQLGEFNVRRLTLAIPSLPPDLDGLTIAHVTDLHAGHFCNIETVGRMTDAVNALQVDLVAFTGDLIDRGLLDRTPIGLRFLNHVDRRHGFAMVEGNHDLNESALQFEQMMRDLKMPLLLDEQLTVRIPGRATPVQFLGVTWGELKTDDESPEPGESLRGSRSWSPDWAEKTIKAVSAMRDPAAFPILLAHHPHSFDFAVQERLPLVLSGHTHGGQIMLTDGLGAGPLRFKYWNGVHVQNQTTMSIANGIGAWFPLRINAPAELVHVTLRRG